MRLVPASLTVSYSLETPSQPVLGAATPKYAPSVGATSIVVAFDERAIPFRTAGEPPERKNGIGSVFGWPWLPGTGLCSCVGSLKRQPPFQ